MLRAMNIKDHTGATPILTALQLGDPYIVKFLLRVLKFGEYKALVEKVYIRALFLDKDEREGISAKDIWGAYTFQHWKEISYQEYNEQTEIGVGGLKALPIVLNPNTGPEKTSFKLKELSLNGKPFTLKDALKPRHNKCRKYLKTNWYKGSIHGRYGNLYDERGKRPNSIISYVYTEESIEGLRELYTEFNDWITE